MNDWENKDYRRISTLTTEKRNISYYIEEGSYFVKWGEKTDGVKHFCNTTV